ncbi:hypothetical protein H1C71_021112 [Ictidomys tridecemlineatus]|nr:hypothetical protein H1C71_021112 [Ictidomys tridecemlineatus]
MDSRQRDVVLCPAAVSMNTLSITGSVCLPPKRLALQPTPAKSVYRTASFQPSPSPSIPSASLSFPCPVGSLACITASKTDIYLFVHSSNIWCQVLRVQERAEQSQARFLTSSNFHSDRRLSL